MIKRGWDWLGLAPALADRVCGLIELPGLAECRTLNKADVFRAGSRGAPPPSARALPPRSSTPHPLRPKGT